MVTTATGHRAVWSDEHKAYVCSTCRVNPADIPADMVAEYGTDLPAAWEDCAETVEVECHIENVYTDGTVRETRTATVPAPRGPLEDWADDHLFPLTGTGWYGDEAMYLLTIIASSDANLAGRTFEWGI